MRFYSHFASLGGLWRRREGIRVLVFSEFDVLHFLSSLRIQRRHDGDARPVEDVGMDHAAVFKSFQGCHLLVIWIQ